MTPASFHPAQMKRDTKMDINEREETMRRKIGEEASDGWGQG